jgi:Holliday junction resolvase
LITSILRSSTSDYMLSDFQLDVTGIISQRMLAKIVDPSKETSLLINHVIIHQLVETRKKFGSSLVIKMCN